MAKIKKLNKYQVAAVNHNHGPAVVFAGAGAGKTAVIEHRTARLLSEGIDPTRILLLTFTNKAADEMLKRVAEKNSAASLVEGGTFHSWARKLLLRHGKSIGIRENFTILDEEDAERLMSDCRLAIAAQWKTRNRPSALTLVKVISHSRNNLVTLKKSLARTAPDFKDQSGFVKAVAKAYRRGKARKGYLDFDDLLVFAVKLLFEHEEVRQVICKSYDYVMVDEFQDTNRTQARLIELIGGYDDPASMRNVMIVTDPGQSMYKFRGAWHENTEAFIDRWQPTILPLNLNYRSTQPILDLANQVDRTRIEEKRRELKAANQDSQAPLPTFFEHPTGINEAQVVVNTILKHKENGVPFKDQAVLMRSAWQGRLVEVELRRRRIPYKFHGGRQINEAAHIKDILAVLRVAENQKDSLALKRVLELIQGIGPATSRDIINEIQDHNGGSFVSALAESLASRTDLDKVLTAVFTAAIGRKSNLAERVKRVSRRMIPLLKQCPKYKEDIDDRLKDLALLPIIALGFVSAREFLAAMTLNGNDLARVTVKAQKPTEEPLTLSTIHSAKGLEWEVVFVVGLNDGAFPSAKSLPKGLGEERRILYVAVTRAKRHLHLSRPVFTGYGATRSPRSRFMTTGVIKRTKTPGHQVG